MPLLDTQRLLTRRTSHRPTRASAADQGSARGSPHDTLQTSARQAQGQAHLPLSGDALLAAAEQEAAEIRVRVDALRIDSRLQRFRIHSDFEATEIAHRRTVTGHRTERVIEEVVEN